MLGSDPTRYDGLCDNEVVHACLPLFSSDSIPSALQRRTSALYMPTTSTRRTSAASYMDTSGHAQPSGATAQPPGAVKPLVLPPSLAGIEGPLTPMLPDTNPEDMTPEQIEEMIKRLMQAKHNALVRLIPALLSPKCTLRYFECQDMSQSELRWLVAERLCRKFSGA